MSEDISASGLNRGCGCTVALLAIAFIALAIFYSTHDNRMEDPLAEYSDQVIEVPAPDSTREIEYFDFSTMEYKYKESIKLEYFRQRRRIPKDNYEKQIIIEGKRYRLDHRNDGTHLIPIR